MLLSIAVSVAAAIALLDIVMIGRTLTYIAVPATIVVRHSDHSTKGTITYATTATAEFRHADQIRRVQAVPPGLLNGFSSRPARDAYSVHAASGGVVWLPSIGSSQATLTRGFMPVNITKEFVLLLLLPMWLASLPRFPARFRRASATLLGMFLPALGMSLHDAWAASAHAWLPVVTFPLLGGFAANTIHRWVAPTQ